MSCLRGRAAGEVPAALRHLTSWGVLGPPAQARQAKLPPLPLGGLFGAGWLRRISHFCTTWVAVAAFAGIPKRAVHWPEGRPAASQIDSVTERVVRYDACGSQLPLIWAPTLLSDGPPRGRNQRSIRKTPKRQAAAKKAAKKRPCNR